MKEKYYIAYGIDICQEQMKRKCPDAELIGKAMLKDYLQSYISYLAKNKNLKGGDGLSVKTIRSMMLMVRKSLHTAVGAGLLDKNPADFIVLPRLEQKPVEALSLEEIKTLIDASREERWGIFFPLAFMTGCRIGELGALRQSSLKCTNGVWYIIVEGSLNRVKDYSGESDKKTVLRVGSTKNSNINKIFCNEQRPVFKILIKQ